jgi:multimeric flavodoxin WrbA
MVQKYKCDNMSKVILLNASPRTNSNTKIVLEECAREIEAEGVEAEIISLKGKKIQSCIACQKCSETGNCVLNDGLDEIIEKIRHADGFIPAAPVYFGTARGDIMAALQRIGKVSRGGDKFLDWMVGGPIAVARRGGVTLTLQEMLMFFAINNMIVAGSTYWNMVIAGPEGTALEDSEGIETIRLFGRNVAKIIKKVRD